MPKCDFNNVAKPEPEKETLAQAFSCEFYEISKNHLQPHESPIDSKNHLQTFMFLQIVFITSQHNYSEPGKYRNVEIFARRSF